MEFGIALRRIRWNSSGRSGIHFNERRNFCTAKVEMPTPDEALDLFSWSQRTLPDHPNKPRNVIFLHGLFGNHENFKILAGLMNKYLDKPLNMFCVDLRNHGDSPRSPKHTYEHMSLDLKKFMSSNDISSTVLVGFSMGGKLAMYHALQNPQSVEALVIVDASPVSYLTQQPHDPRFNAIKNILLHKIRHQKDAENAMGKLVPDRGEKFFILRNLVQDPDGRWRWKIDMENLSESQHLMLDFPQVPQEPFTKKCLFIGANQSYRLAQPNQPAVKSLFPNSKLEILNGGHYIYVQYPTKVADMVVSFFRELPETGEIGVSSSAGGRVEAPI